MDLLRTFEVMSGSTTGRDHRTVNPPSPNQDRVLTEVRPSLIVSCFSDGCSSGEQSGVGAELTVNTLMTGILNRQKCGKPYNEKWFKRLYWYLVETLWAQAESILPPEDRKDEDKLLEIIMSHMLATAGGCVVGRDETLLFGVPEVWGLLNGNQFSWLPAKKNFAPYPALAYHHKDEEHFGAFRVEVYRTADLQTLMMGTDGVERLFQVCDTLSVNIPGTETLVGPSWQIFERGEFYADPNACSEWLNTLAAGKEGGEDTFPGLLGDDTTIFGLRRKER